MNRTYSVEVDSGEVFCAFCGNKGKLEAVVFSKWAVSLRFAHGDESYCMVGYSRTAVAGEGRR